MLCHAGHVGVQHALIRSTTPKRQDTLLACVYLCMCVCLYICMYVHLYVYVCTYIYVERSGGFEQDQVAISSAHSKQIAKTIQTECNIITAEN